ncbi:MAG: hypothetical protein BWK76_23490 [Desulfobulbaceae bacterium A2]|nr:MAG: hypothetical protein BWK76_23490 [Desulfobulbaceae bacterium A2]
MANPENAALLAAIARGEARAVGRAISLAEEGRAGELLQGLARERIEQSLILGMTGPPGVGKSTLTGALVAALRRRGLRTGIVAVDPSSPLTGGALLGDRIRLMDHALDPEVLVRSMASRGRLGGLCAAAGAACRIMAAAGCRVVIVETVGVGQSELDVVRLADITVLVLAPHAGDDIQAMKAGLSEVVDLLVLNKADLAGSDRMQLDLASGLTGRSPLCTVAREGRGVEELLDSVLTLASVRRGDGSWTARRRDSRRQETLERALELLRPELERRLGEAADNDEPLRAAQVLVGNVLRQWGA